MPTKTNIKERKIKVVCNCSKCGQFLMDTSPMTKESIHKEWALLVMSAPLNAPRCPKCKYSTWSDCNAGNSFELRYIDTNRKINQDKFFAKT